MTEHAPFAVRLTHRLEEDQRLEPIAAALGPFAEKVTANPAVADLLRGRPAGHAAHPALTDLPIGAWTSATLLDLIGGESGRSAARTLVGAGVLSAVPVSVTGLAEWTHTDARSGRLGALHAVGNTAALVLMGLSWLARGHGHHRRGTALALVGNAVAAASGYLGGHLAAARNVASRDASYADSLPADAGTDQREAMLT